MAVGIDGKVTINACPTSTQPATAMTVATTSLPPLQHATTTSTAKAPLKPANTHGLTTSNETQTTQELALTPKHSTSTTVTSQPFSAMLTTRSITSVPIWFNFLTLDNLAQETRLSDFRVRNVRQAAQEWPLTMMNSLSTPLGRVRGPPTTPAPSGLTVLTKDGSAFEVPLADVEIRIIRLTVQDGSVMIANSSTDANGTMWADIATAEQLIIVASKKGYLDTSSTYRFKLEERNIHTILMQKHSMKKEITWMSGLDRLVEFRPRFKGIPYSFEIPAGSLDTPEQSRVEFKFQDVDTSNPSELRQAPELIGAVDSSEGTTLIGLAVFSMAELTVVNVDNEQPVDLMLPFEAEFPLSRKPRGTRQGSRIPAWYFDKMTGVWRKGGVGKVRLDRFKEPVWSFEARHFTWWGAMQPWAGTSCIIVKTCYDQECLQIGSFIPVEVDGVDFSYSSSTVSSGEGRTCAQFKMGGNVRITSPFSQNAKLVAGNPVSGSSCPLEYDTLVLRPPGQAQMGQCQEVVVVLRDPSATTEPSKTSKPLITTQPAPTTTLEPATTIPQTTPTTLPPTPPPTGLTVLTMDGSTQQALLPDVQVRIIRPAIVILPVTTTTISSMTNSSMTNSSMMNSSMTNSSMTNSSLTNSSMTNSLMTNSSTGNSSMMNSTVNDSLITAYTTVDGLALLDIPLDEPVIVVASKAGYLETSFTYCFQPGVKNVLPILIHKHSFTEQFVWMSEEDHSVEFRHSEHKIPYRLDIPAGSLNVTDGSVVEVRFSGVHTSHPTELKEVPELIGATESPDGMKLTGLEAFSMAEVTVVNAETDDLVDVVLPFNAVFPLDRKPKGAHHGTKIPAWYFDKTTGTWKEDGIGKVKNKAGELVWSFQARHFTWWSAIQPWPETSCLIIKTCYEKNCKRVASFVPVEVHGVDFSYTSTSVTSGEGQTCTHFKMGGQVRVSSPCSKKPKFRIGELGGTTYCPENTQVLRPQDQTETGRCEQVVIVVREDWTMRCSEPDIHTKAESTQFGMGSTTFFQCLGGYNLVGQPQRACLACGKWSGPDPICTR